MMRDVRPMDFPRSYQYALYARARSASGVPSRRSALVSASSFSASTSAALNSSVPPFSAGRSSGVMVAYDHLPCRSGSPHAVRGGVHVFLAAGVWPAIKAAVSARVATTTVRIRIFNLLSIRPVTRQG